MCFILFIYGRSPTIKRWKTRKNINYWHSIFKYLQNYRGLHTKQTLQHLFFKLCHFFFLCRHWCLLTSKQLIKFLSRGLIEPPRPKYKANFRIRQDSNPSHLGARSRVLFALDNGYYTIPERSLFQKTEKRFPVCKVAYIRKKFLKWQW